MSQYLFTRPATERQFTVSPGRNYDTAQFSFSLSPPRGQFRRHSHPFFPQRRPLTRLGPTRPLWGPIFFRSKNRCVAVRAGRVRVVGRGPTASGGGRRARKKTHTFLAHDHHAPCTLTILLSLRKGPRRGETREKMHADQGDKCLQLSATELVLERTGGGN